MFARCRALPVTLNLALALVGTAEVARAQVGSCAPAPTALVLSGGGAKGFAHVGLLHTLDSLGIVPDYIVGSSVGAIIGAMYASGLSAARIDTMLREVGLSSVVRRYEPHVSGALGGLRPVVVWERTPRRWVVQAGTFREGEVNAIISRLLLRGNLLARGDFDSLPIPFRAVAADLNSRAPVALGEGDLAEAVRASFALPVVLRPIELQGLWLADGGIASNVPVGVARALGAQRLIVSTLPTASVPPGAFEDPLTVTSTLFDYLWVQDSLGLGAEDVLVAHPTHGFGTMGFDSLTLDSLTRLGREASREVFRGDVCARPLNGATRPVPFPTTVARVELATAEIRGKDALVRETGLIAGRALDTLALSRGFVRVAGAERHRALWLSPSGEGESVSFTLRAEPAPRRSFGLGFAFDHLMSGRFWAGGVDRALFGRDLEGAALFAVGTYRTDLMLAARRRARIGDNFLPVGVSVELLAEDVRLYAGNGELAPAHAEELAVVTGIRPLLEAGWTYELGTDFRLWRESGVSTRGTLGGRGAIRRRVEGAPEPTFTLEGIALPDWQRVRLDAAASRTFGRVEVRPHIRFGFGKELPVQHTFTLGGLEGFAGLRPLEVRGEQEAYGSLLVRWPLWRQLRGRVEPMAGVMGSGSGLFERRGETDGVILIGGRIGVELDSPIGPIRIEQGFNNLDRRESLVRVGYWF